jgi:hypothetical protein
VSGLPLSAWGRHLDDELVNVVPVVLYAAVVTTVDVLPGDVGSRGEPCHLLLTQAEMQALAEAHWSRWTHVHVWEVPGLRFDTLHGSVVVADRWNDTEFTFLQTRAGRRALRINTPLRVVAELICMAEHTVVEDGFPDFLIAAVGWRETKPLTQADLRYHYSLRGDDVDELAWVFEYHDYNPAGVRAVRAAYRSVNSKEARDAVKIVWDRARAASDENGGIDVHAGIAQLERYLDGQA